jgi:hypothetical protein
MLSLKWKILLATGDVIEDMKWFFTGRSEEIFFFFFCVLPVPRRKCVCDRFRFPTV